METQAVRCSCGEHDLAAGVRRPCHVCGHVTVSAPVIVWELGRMYYPICHRCSGQMEWPYVLVHQAPEAMLAEAYAFGRPLSVEGRA